MNHENQYTELIAGAHFEKPKYSRFIYEITEPLNIARKRLALLYENFDVDTAVGVQLDAIGVRVGISRHLPMKLIGIYFALDDVDGVGFDRGVWKGKYDPDDGIDSLDDETYRPKSSPINSMAKTSQFLNFLTQCSVTLAYRQKFSIFRTSKTCT